ncbi:MAG: hypothetical protein JWM34_1321 [Ilumatobacteraceae bacterium]|nr:hypothetical protein [Ilumatobacteraceae bacterium]
MTFARDLWLRIETIHAVTYFGDETTTAAAALGITGFWRAYFGMRAAPLGPVGAGAVEATFCNFALPFVQRWVPEVWTLATPGQLLDARLSAAVQTLVRIDPQAAELATAANPTLLEAVQRAAGSGRALFAANRLLPVPDESPARLWHLCTCLREHRGDGHVAALTAAGIDGLEGHVLIAAEQDNSPTDLQRTRGWTEDDWAGAVDRLRSRGLLDRAGALTAAGAAVRIDVEARTDTLAAAPFGRLSVADSDALIDALDPLARAVSAAGLIRYPNPIGLPPLT